MDPRSPFVLSTHELARRPGTMREVEREVPAPEDVGTAVMGVVAGSPITLDLRRESVLDGVLVSGEAEVQLRGECVRCLREISETRTVEVSELYFYPGARATALEQGDESCRGLCPGCGERLDDLPADHEHVDVDPRWAALAGLASGSAGDDDDDPGAQHEERPSADEGR